MIAATVCRARVSEPERTLLIRHVRARLTHFIIFTVHRELVRTHFDALLCRRDEVRVVVRTLVYVAVGVLLLLCSEDELGFRYEALTVVLEHALLETY